MRVVAEVERGARRLLRMFGGLMGARTWMTWLVEEGEDTAGWQMRKSRLNIVVKRGRPDESSRRKEHSIGDHVM